MFLTFVFVLPVPSIAVGIDLQECRRQVASPCFHVLKLSRCPLSFAATFAALPSISEIPFLDS